MAQSEPDYDNECIICTLRYDEKLRMRIKLICKHEVCALCLPQLRVKGNNQKCPMCRHEEQKVDPMKLYDQVMKVAEAESNHKLESHGREADEVSKIAFKFGKRIIHDQKKQLKDKKAELQGKKEEMKGGKRKELKELADALRAEKRRIRNEMEDYRLLRRQCKLLKEKVEQPIGVTAEDRRKVLNVYTEMHKEKKQKKTKIQEDHAKYSKSKEELKLMSEEYDRELETLRKEIEAYKGDCTLVKQEIDLMKKIKASLEDDE